MVEFPRDHSPARPGSAEASGTAASLSAIIAASVVTVAVLLPFRGAAPVWFSAGLFVLVSGVMLARIGVREAQPRFGAANTVTLLRAAAVAVMAGFALEPAAVAATGPWTLFLVALALLALDGIDGWLARRQGLETGFGARFDMEVDALFILVLAVMAFGLGKAGPWVIGLGLLRYGFVAAGWVWPWLAAPLPPSLRRKAICVLQVAVLAALTVPVITPPLSQTLAGLAFAALVWSFTVDIRWLAGHRAKGRS